MGNIYLKRHIFRNEINDILARKICKDRAIPAVK